VLALLFHLSGASWTATEVPFPSRIDELHHVSYIVAMAEAPALFPDFERMRVLDGRGERFTSKGNHLNHPSPYYHLMALIGTVADSGPPRIRLLRMASLVLSGAGVLLMLLGGMALLPNLATFAAFAGILVMFPKLAVVGGLINNDNLGVLAAGLCFASLARLYQGETSRTGVLLGLGIALAGWTKLTVLVMVGLAVLIGEVLRLGAVADRARWPVLGIAAAVGSVGVVPTVQNLIGYGAPLYIFIRPGHNFIPVADRPDLDILTHGVLFFHHMALKWPALEPAQWLQSLGFAAVVLGVLAVGATWAVSRLGRGNAIPDPADGGAASLMAVAYGLSATATVFIHMAFGWEMFRKMGDLTAAQPRYYYVVWPGVALAGAVALRLLPAGRWRFYGTLAVLLLLGLATIQIAAVSAALTGTPLTPR